MRNKIKFVLLSALLIFISLFLLIRGSLAFTDEDYEREFLREYREIKKLIERQRKIFDEFFERQFRRSFFDEYCDLFKKIQERHLRDLKRIEDKLESTIFDFHFKDWSGRKFGREIAYKISQEESEKERKFLIEFNKDFDVSNVAVEVKDGFITIESKVDSTTQTTSKKGKYTKDFSFYFYRKFSLPSDVKADKPVIEKSENKIIIKFEKK